MGGLVSVIVPTYKRPDRLMGTLDSIKAQSYRNIEIIVVDDNSPGDDYRRATESFITKYSSTFPLKYVKMDQNAGGAMARNRGISEAEGDFITFLDDDDEYLPEKVEKQVDKFTNSPMGNLGLIYCQINFMDSRGKFRKMRAPMNARGNKDALKKHMIRNLAPTSGLMIPKKVLDRVGGFADLLTGHEYELILRILISGYNVDFNEEALVNMHYHTSGRISTSRKKIRGEKALFQIKKKYFHLVGEKVAKRVSYEHFMDLCKRYLRQNDKRASRLYLKKAYRMDPLKIQTFLAYSGILADERMRRIKSRSGL
ncbi:MAG TPA: glycosyltransferase family 2 protein [Candidatus Mcinerneyibacteriales bacterium]|nr:glycosyltransferase family 2 protein [Candidatus Mcinerneyibacteriales bacterium]HPJ69441.1 glycosyltransferase family 2 protein [Candidatus Mcinerneyibacteriales bacterium]HPQ88558.1 glycosyltransferase family 2 protein [Candidatus Mcinerneyibacteriales bacterium]